VHRLDGDLAAPAQPICFGHEGVGIIEALGRGITHDRGGSLLAVGDRIYWSPPTPCGACAPCQRSEPTPVGSLGNPLADFGRNVAIAATHGDALGFASRFGPGADSDTPGRTRQHVFGQHI